jgi:hypothetical protein
MAESDLLWGGIIVLVMGFVLFLVGFIFLRKKRLIENTPTSKIRSLAMGLVEVYGEVVPAKEVVLKSPLQNKDCVYYHYTVEEYRQSGKNSRWVTLENNTKSVEFFLRDDTGTVLVNAEGAEIEIPMDFESKTRPSFFKMSVNMGPLGFSLGEPQRRYREWLIEPKDKLYIMGNAGDNPFVDEGTATENVADIMMQKGGPMFYITNKTEKDVVSSFGWRVGGFLGGGFLMILGGLAAILKYLNMF